MESDQRRGTPPGKLFRANAFTEPTLKTLGIIGVLAMIHDAFGHVITPINKLPQAFPVLERIAGALEKIADHFQAQEPIAKSRSRLRKKTVGRTSVRATRSWSGSAAKPRRS